MVMLSFALHPRQYVMVRLPVESEPVVWAEEPHSIIVRSTRETTVVCRYRNGLVPPELEQSEKLSCLEVLDTSDLESVGIAAAAIAPVAAAGISLFIFSTWSNDLVFIKETDVAAACSALTSAGHKIEAQQAEQT